MTASVSAETWTQIQLHVALANVAKQFSCFISYHLAQFSTALLVLPLLSAAVISREDVTILIFAVKAQA